jgi:hypothetical protein
MLEGEMNSRDPRKVLSCDMKITIFVGKEEVFPLFPHTVCVVGTLSVVEFCLR